MTRDEEEWSLLKLTAEWFLSKLIRRNIDLAPMAVTISPRGEVKGVMVQPAEGGGDVYEQLLAALRQAVTEGRYRGVAVCALGSVTEPGAPGKTRAVIVDIEHQGLDPITWIWPFEKVGGDYCFGGRTGEGYIRAGTRRVFGTPGGGAEGDSPGPFGRLVETIAVAPADLSRMKSLAAGRGNR